MDGPSAFHRRTVDPPLDFQKRLRINRLQAANPPLDHLAVLDVRDGQVDRRRGAFRDDVRPRAAADGAHTQRKALMRTRQFFDPQELARELADGVDARRWVDAGVRGTPADRNPEFAGAFT